MDFKALRKVVVPATMITAMLLSTNIAEAKEKDTEGTREITLFTKGEKRQFITTSDTVGEFLQEINVEVKEKDKVVPSLDYKLKEDSEILVIPVEQKDITEEEVIPYLTEQQFSFDLPVGETIVIQKGHTGLKTTTYKQEEKNGIIVSKEKVEEKVVSKPINEILIVGTKETKVIKTPFETEEKKTNSLFKGEKRVIQKGKDGKTINVYNNNGADRKLISSEVKSEPVTKIIEIGTKEKPVEEPKTVSYSSPTSSKYTLSQFKFHGVVHDGGRKFTYYSQSVLPGGGLKIPGRHVNSGGYVADSNGYIVLAAGRSIPKGTVINTPFGYQGKVYDVCASCDSSWFDVYIK